MIQRPSDAAASVWAKSPKKDGMDHLPLWRHLADSAAVAGLLWDRWLPASTRRLIAERLPAGDADGRLLVIWLAGVHDIGKATPSFALKCRPLARPMRAHGLAMPETLPEQDFKLAPHGTTGQILLERWLGAEHGWTLAQARPYAVVVGGHHGVPPDLDGLREADRPHLLGKDRWCEVQRELLDRTAVDHGVADRLPHWRTVTLSQPVQVLLTAVVIVADWIASNEDLFPYDPERLHTPSRLYDAWDELDLPTPWQPVADDAPAEKLFGQRFRLPAGAVVRPVQTAAVELSRQMPVSGLMVIEAPMGEGKTEAALAAAEQLAARTGAGGCFVALPTRATSDAMFGRVLDWLERLPDAERERGAMSVMLAHGKARFQADFDKLSRDRIRPGRVTLEDGSTRDLGVHRWLSGRKKAMLSSFVIGTIDQLLFGALKSRHLALRHLGLAGKVVVIDEAHAYDVYMSEYLDRALEWLAAYRVPTIVLSATLPARRRRELIMAYDRGRGVAPKAPTSAAKPWLPQPPPPTDPYVTLDGDVGYPVLTASGKTATPTVRVVDSASVGTRLEVAPLADDPAAIAALLRGALAEGGCALVVRNTVRRVQSTASDLRTALAGTPIGVSVAHSRFLAPDRSRKDTWLRDSFGPPQHLAKVGGVRPAAHVVVASQVAEQSLDIDFDLLVTDLAPADLVLQRAGRLHRHHRPFRPAPVSQARCYVTGVDWDAVPPEPVRGSVHVYGRHPLLRSLAVLAPYLDGRKLALPADIAPVVQAAYGDGPIGPAPWQDAMSTAEAEHVDKMAKKKQKADTFRLGEVSVEPRPVVGWLAAGAGDVDDSIKGRQQVRDAGAESLEVLVLVRREDGALVVPPWLTDGGGTMVPDDFTPEPRVAKQVASCSLALPIQLCSDAVIDELENRNHFEAWNASRWLEGELLLVVEEGGSATLGGYKIQYDPEDGLLVTAEESS